MRRMVVVALVLSSLALPAGARAWSWPTSGAVLRPFSFGPNPYAGGEHRGIVTKIADAGKKRKRGDLVRWAGLPAKAADPMPGVGLDAGATKQQ